MSHTPGPWTTKVNGYLNQDLRDEAARRIPAVRAVIAKAKGG